MRLAAHWSPGGGGGGRRGSAFTACSTSQKGSRFIRCPAARNRFSAKLHIKKKKKKKTLAVSIPVFLQEEQSARRLWPASGLPVMLSERLEEKQAEKLGGR